MSIRKQFQQMLGLEKGLSPVIQLQPDLLHAIETIALRENTTVDRVVDDLLHFALSEHQLAKDSLQIWRQLTRVNVKSSPSSGWD